ncbi:MAG TPA: zf-HC2 domain-containing protein [Bryobacteraceae bacterium]|nr:zf-HC2 domain-containing protein [Bryobacteraceae bacterium]
MRIDGCYQDSHPTEARLLLAFDQELEPQEAAAIAQHMEVCEACRGQWEQWKTLSDGIVEYHHALRSEKSVGRRNHVPAILAALAVAALVLIALFIGRPHRTEKTRERAVVTPASPAQRATIDPQPPVRPLRARHRRLARGGAATASFIALPFSDSALPLGDATVVRVELPVDELRLAGLTVDGGHGGSLVQADLLMGIDGLPRGIRFVQQ